MLVEHETLQWRETHKLNLQTPSGNRRDRALGEVVSNCRGVGMGERGCLVPTAPMAKIDNDHAYTHTHTHCRVWTTSRAVDPQWLGKWMWCNGNIVSELHNFRCAAFGQLPSRTLTFLSGTATLPAPYRWGPLRWHPGWFAATGASACPLGRCSLRAVRSSCSTWPACPAPRVPCRPSMPSGQWPSAHHWPDAMAVDRHWSAVRGHELRHRWRPGSGTWRNPGTPGAFHRSGCIWHRWGPSGGRYEI